MSEQAPAPEMASEEKKEKNQKGGKKKVDKAKTKKVRKAERKARREIEQSLNDADKKKFVYRVYTSVMGIEFSKIEAKVAYCHVFWLCAGLILFCGGMGSRMDRQIDSVTLMYDMEHAPNGVYVLNQLMEYHDRLENLSCVYDWLYNENTDHYMMGDLLFTGDMFNDDDLKTKPDRCAHLDMDWMSLTGRQRILRRQHSFASDSSRVCDWLGQTLNRSQNAQQLAYKSVLLENVLRNHTEEIAVMNSTDGTGTHSTCGRTGTIYKVKKMIGEMTSRTNDESTAFSPLFDMIMLEWNDLDRLEELLMPAVIECNNPTGFNIKINGTDGMGDAGVPQGEITKSCSNEEDQNNSTVMKKYSIYEEPEETTWTVANWTVANWTVASSTEESEN